MAGQRFWSDVSVEPKRQYRWMLTLQGAEEKIETYAIKTVKKPSFQVSEVPVQYVAHTFYYPGRVTWQPVEITFIDPVVPDQTSVITNMIVDGGYKIPKTEAIARQSFSKSELVTAIGSPQIMQLDAAGGPIEQWTLNNSFFTNVDFGQLDYSSDELVINSITLRYDYATLETFSGAGPASKLTP